MRFVSAIDVKIPGVKKNFDLGDLTVLVGRSNCGKTRTLNEIQHLLGNLNDRINKGIDFQVKKTQAHKLGITLENSEKLDSVQPIMIKAERGGTNSINAFASILTAYESAAKIMDPKILQIANDRVSHVNGLNLTYKDQGSGIRNLANIMELANRGPPIVLIDEPEVSLSPDGKIQLLKVIFEMLKEKQVIIATHDPTLINSHLLNTFNSGNNYLITAHSFNGAEFKKIDLSPHSDPEIRVGCMSQTYSGKPVHLLVEGPTDYYVMEALIWKYLMKKDFKDFPKIMNRISLSHLEGNSWDKHLQHSPPKDYYELLVMLDSEHKATLSAIEKTHNLNLIGSTDKIAPDKMNVALIGSKQIEDAFKDIFPEIETFDKPARLAREIWNYKNDIIEEMSSGNDDLKLIVEIVKWLVEKARNWSY